MLAPYEGVVAAETAHVAAHEAGAIEYSGHKVLTIPQHEGKILAEELETFKVSQEPVIEYLKTEIDPEVVDGLLGAVEEEEIKAGLK